MMLKTLEIQLSGSTDNMEYVFGYYSLKDDAFTANPQSFFGGGSVFAQNYSGTSDAKHFLARSHGLLQINGT